MLALVRVSKAEATAMPQQTQQKRPRDGVCKLRRETQNGSNEMPKMLPSGIQKQTTQTGNQESKSTLSYQSSYAIPAAKGWQASTIPEQ